MGPGGMIVKKLKHLQGSKTTGAGGNAWRQLGCLGSLAGLANYPGVFLELLAGGKGVCETVEFVMVRNGEAKQAFEIGTDHDNGGDEIAVLLPLSDVFPGSEEQLHLGNAEFEDQVGQQFPLSQCTAEQLETTAAFEPVFLELCGGIIADDMDAIVELGTDSLFPDAACEGEGMQIALETGHTAIMVAAGMQGLELSENIIIDLLGQTLDHGFEDTIERSSGIALAPRRGGSRRCRGVGRGGRGRRDTVIGTERGDGASRRCRRGRRWRLLTLKIAIEVAGGGIGHSVGAGNGVDNGVHSDIGRITNGLAGIRNDCKKRI